MSESERIRLGHILAAISALTVSLGVTGPASGLDAGSKDASKMHLSSTPTQDIATGHASGKRQWKPVSVTVKHTVKLQTVKLQNGVKPNQ
jgi:hypothetical protein